MGENRGYPQDEQGFYYDPQEKDPRFGEIIRQAGHEAVKNLEKKMPGIKGKPGYCRFLWMEKKNILIQKYGIDWKSPAELNPGVRFD